MFVFLFFTFLFAETTSQVVVPIYKRPPIIASYESGGFFATVNNETSESIITGEVLLISGPT